MRHFLCHLNFKMHDLFPERPVCIHCLQSLSLYMSRIIEHCRTCAAMSRPNPYRYKFVCYACSFSTYLCGNMRNHVYIHLGEKPYACLECDYRAVRKQHIEKHTARRHAKFQ